MIQQKINLGSMSASRNKMIPLTYSPTLKPSDQTTLERKQSKTVYLPELNLQQKSTSNFAITKHVTCLIESSNGLQKRKKNEQSFKVESNVKRINRILRQQDKSNHERYAESVEIGKISETKNYQDNQMKPYEAQQLQNIVQKKQLILLQKLNKNPLQNERTDYSQKKQAQSFEKQERVNLSEQKKMNKKYYISSPNIVNIEDSIKYSKKQFIRRMDKQLNKSGNAFLLETFSKSINENQNKQPNQSNIRERDQTHKQLHFKHKKYNTCDHNQSSCHYQYKKNYLLEFRSKIKKNRLEFLIFKNNKNNSESEQEGKEHEIMLPALAQIKSYENYVTSEDQLWRAKTKRQGEAHSKSNSPRKLRANPKERAKTEQKLAKSEQILNEGMGLEVVQSN